MIFTNLDTIVKSVLLRKGYSMHWYLQALKYGADCVRELMIHSMKKVNTVALTANNYGAIDVPCDYMAWVRVGILNGQYVIPLVQGKGSFNPLVVTDGAGAAVAYDSPVMGGVSISKWVSSWGNTTNELGEFVGGIYGYGAGYETDTFEEMPNRNQIQLHQELAGRTIILDYLADATKCDNITQVEILAQATIEQYIIWQLKEHARHYSKGEAKDDERMYWNELRHFRARKNPISPEDVIRIMRRNYKGSIKS